MTEKDNTKQLNIRGIDSSVKRQFEQLKDEKRFKSHSELLVELLNHYTLNEKLFNPQEQKTFNDALLIKNITPQELVKMSVIQFCNRIIKNNKFGKLEHKYTMESNNRLDTIVKEIMVNNDNAKLKDDKIYINQTTLLKVKKFSVPVVKRYLNNNKKMLDQHHSKHDLSSNHNRDVANFRKTKIKL